MPIDVDRLLGAQLPATRSSWTADQVILYHLGLGAGATPTDPRELTYVYEEALTVLPSFAVIPAFSWLPPLDQVPGLDINPAMLLHSHQELELSGPLPVAGEVTTTGRIARVHDRGKGAVVVFEATSSDADGTVRFVNRYSCFIRGEGGFGGDPGPHETSDPPDRSPDHVVRCTTLPQQALLYRLSGDRNPLHADPAVATRAGFDQPILHGLCTFGIACKAVVDAVLDGDGSRVARYRARFAGVVFPGETLVVRIWHQDGAVSMDVASEQRDARVITNGEITLRSEQ